MEPKYEYQSDLVRRAVGIGRVEGRAEGRAAALTKLMAQKLGPLDPPTLARIEQGSLDELDTWLGRVLDATSLADVFDPWHFASTLGGGSGRFPDGARTRRHGACSPGRAHRPGREFIRRAVGFGRVEGEAKGRAAGKAEGEASGRAASLTKQLEKKLGPLDTPTLARIQQGSLEELDTWSVRVLDATSLTDLFDP